MLANDKLIAYMKLKQVILQEKGGLTVPYFTEEDEEDLKGWDITSAGMVCVVIHDTLLKYIAHFLNQEETEECYADDLMHGPYCPWCWKHQRLELWRYFVYHNGSCDVCPYGTRNGICRDSSSRWRQIMQEISKKGMAVPLTRADLTSLVNCLEDKS